MIKVRCPNAACRKVHAVHPQFAGRRGKCPDCGAVVSVPAAPKSVAAPTPAAAADAGSAVVRVGCIGRGNAGKTALFHALGEGLVGDFLPSGLHADAADPREVARLIREAEETQRLLERSGLPPTAKPSDIQYCIYDGDDACIAYRMREVVGQILTHTLPDSAAELQVRYRDFLRSLVDAHVLWAVVPCPPPDPGPRDRRRYANDLRITVAYLREALRLRPRGEPVAVALVLSKIDTLFADAAEARAALTDDALRTALGPLINLVRTSPRVSDAAVVPVTAFGFGTAVRRDGDAERDGAADEPFGAEPVWLLKEGVSPQPYNLDTLFLWTLLLGLYTQVGRGVNPETPIRGIYRRLSDDLEKADPWLLAVKGRAVDERKTAATGRA